MSLEFVLYEKTLKSRYTLLSNFLKNNNIGELSKENIIWFKHIFQKFYEPDKTDVKFKINEILNVSISISQYGNKGFVILVNDKWYPASIKRLSGSNRNSNANLIRAMRTAIMPQIADFRKKNPLIVNNICPITNKILGEDAQVDHEIPFHILSKDWLSINKKVYYTYNIEKFDYILNEPYLKSWEEFHLKKSKLRWLSKEGNKSAHKYYKK